MPTATIQTTDTLTFAKLEGLYCTDVRRILARRAYQRLIDLVVYARNHASDPSRGMARLRACSVKTYRGKGLLTVQTFLDLTDPPLSINNSRLTWTERDAEQASRVRADLLAALAS
jgi:hypothetical protein